MKHIARAYFVAVGSLTVIMSFGSMILAPALMPSKASAAPRSEVVGSSAARVSTPATAKQPELTAEETKQGGQLSPYPSCAGMLMVESSDYQKNKSYWEGRKKSCDPKVASCNLKVQMIPDSGVFASRSVTAGKNVSSQLSLGAFLEKVRVRAGQDLRKNLAHYQTLSKACLSDAWTAKEYRSKMSADSCKQSLADIRKRVGAQTASSRIAVGMMAIPSDNDIREALATGNVSSFINSELSAKRANIKFPKVDALSAKEVAKITTEYRALIAKARKDHEAEIEKLLEPLKVRGRETDLIKQRADLSRPENLTQFIKQELARHRGEQVLKFNQAVFNAPELPYIGDGKASDALMASGLAAMIEDVEGSLARIEKSPADKKDLTAKKIDSSLLQYASYSQLIDKMLTEEQAAKGSSSCAIATAGFNQLKSAEGRMAGYITAGMVIGSVGFALAPWGASLMGGSMSAGAAMVSTGLSVASGVIGGAALNTIDTTRANRLDQDSRTGLVTAEDASEAKNSAAVGLLLAPLDFMGAGAVVGGVVAVGGKSLSRFGAAAVAKGRIKPTGGNSDDVLKLAAAASTATSTSAKAAAVANLEKIGDKAAETLLGRAPAVSDEKSFEALAKSGALGSPENPNVAVAQNYAEVTKGMSSAQRDAYAADLAKVTEAASVVPKTKSPEVVRDLADAKRKEQAGLLAIEVAAGAPNKQATAALLAPGSGYDATALSGVRAVMKAAKDLARGTGEVVGAKAGVAYRNAIAKLSGKAPGSKEVDQMCICSQLCGVRSVGANDIGQASNEVVAAADGAAGGTEATEAGTVTGSKEHTGAGAVAGPDANQSPSRSIASVSDDYRADQQQACLAR